MAITGAQLITEIQSLAAQAGGKYFYGGDTPSTGFDCSGLIYDALTKLGYSNPPRTSEAQWAWVQQNNATVTSAQLQPGDLVFAQFAGDNASPGHVGVYIGNGQVYSAQDPSLGIGVATLSSWGSNIVGYGRVPSETTSGATGTGSNTSDAQTTDFSWTSIDPFPGSIVGKVFSGVSGDFSTIGDVGKAISGLTLAASKFMELFALLFRPEFWLRVGAFVVATAALGAGLYFMKGSVTLWLSKIWDHWVLLTC
jgi:hypothetical protein